MPTASAESKPPATALSTVEKHPSRATHLAPHQFKPGAPSANPSGRPKGSRNKLAEDFLRDLADDFAVHGKQAITDVRTQDPSTYLKIVSQLVPKEFVIREAGLSDLTDEQLVEALENLKSNRAKIVNGSDT